MGRRYQLLDIFLFLFFFFRLHRATCGILVPQSEIEPGPPVVEAQSPWTTREVPCGHSSGWLVVR